MLFWAELRQVSSAVIRRLRWADVVPEKRRLDLGLARQALEIQVERALAFKVEERVLEDWIDEELGWHFGIWLAGWRSGVMGGPVRAYDNLSSSEGLMANEQVDPEPTVRRVLGALVEWQEFLESVDLHFAMLAEGELDIELAAARMLPLIVARTGANDAWYDTLTQALCWYLEYREVDARDYRKAIAEVVSGHFDSHIAPTAAEMEQGSRQIGAAFAAVVARPQLDALQEWLAVRGTFPKHHWGTLDEVPKLRQDGHLEYIERKERDPRMEQALKLSRTWARGGEPLTVEEIRRWQTVVLGAESELRTTEAFAKNGRERYGVAQLSELQSKLAEANVVEVSVDWRAAMAYLDICFFHPFADGNARLARLVLDAILWREGYALQYVDPVFVVSRAARDEWGGGTLASVINSLLGRL